MDSDLKIYHQTKTDSAKWTFFMVPKDLVNDIVLSLNTNVNDTNSKGWKLSQHGGFAVEQWTKEHICDFFDRDHSEWEMLNVENPELFQRILQMMYDVTGLTPEDGIVFQHLMFFDSDYESCKPIEQKAQKIIRMRLGINSSTDVVTNSSSEIYMINRQETAEQFENYLTLYSNDRMNEDSPNYDPDEECGGAGGEINVKEINFKRNFVYVFIHPCFYTFGKSVPKHLGLEDDALMEWPANTLTDEDWKEIERIYRKVNNLPNIGSILIISIDQCLLATIEHLRSLGAVEI